MLKISLEYLEYHIWTDMVEQWLRSSTHNWAPRVPFQNPTCIASDTNVCYIPFNFICRWQVMSTVEAEFHSFLYVKEKETQLNDSLTVCYFYAPSCRMSQQRYPRLASYYNMLKDRPSIKATWPPHWLEGPGSDTIKDLWDSAQLLSQNTVVESLLGATSI